ncbi:hypothetical protein B0T20DRAFT_89694 [Sordaria brevicollis]|uniref:VLRF1 domain-containing protein n=1 Tax=Sordaria brevicollis TaxID=83679 RepID=A0AAE0NWM2_SORBR|nr:hypothetical protein B0T20DRAFT_89694 [Sordaria brevicollis]
MAGNQEDLQRRLVYLYDINADILNNIALKSDAQITDEPVDESAKQTSDATSVEPTTSGSQASCSLCSLKFDNVQEQRSHLKTDFHHYNLKQKLNGLEPVTETKFEELVNNLDESISGSDASESEDEEEGQDKDTNMLSALLKKQANLAGKKAKEDDNDDDNEGAKMKTSSGSQPLLWFSSPKLPENSYYGVYKAMFTPEELKKEDAIVDAIKSRQLPPITMGKPPKDASDMPPNYTGKHIFMCMIGGGHFAAMVVALNPRKTKHGTTGPLNKEAIVLVHKTFHRYTTRRKQGGSQSANDNAKGAAHSAGANLRRYNEQALVEDVRGLLAEWKNLIDTSELLFVRATGLTNRRTLFGPYDGQVLRANDPRIRGFPFMTRRPTQNELMRAFIELTRLKVRQIVPEAAVPAAESSKRPKSPSKPAAASKPKLSEEEETLLLHTQQIQALIKRSKVPALLSYISTNEISLKKFRFFPADHHTPTPLHLAASQNSAPLVTNLLTRAGADPTIPNGDGRTPFELAGDRATRDAFRVARSELGEEAWDWDAAKVPVALSRDEALKRTEREKNEAKEKEDQRRKAEEERLKKEGPKVSNSGKKASGSVLAAAMKLTPQERREEEAKGLTPEMKMRLERERRARAAEERIRRMQGGQ